jgi:hypothetical protein
MIKGIAALLTALGVIASGAVAARAGEPTNVAEAQALCNKGDGQGCYWLATALGTGRGIEQNQLAANAIFERSCLQGYQPACGQVSNSSTPQAPAPAPVMAQDRLPAPAPIAAQVRASAQAAGSGEPDDLVQAKALCDKGNAHGCNDAGAIYYMGDGVSRDYARAVPYFKTACNKGVASGCFNLGMAYSGGYGVPTDQAKADALFIKGCKGGDQQSCVKAPDAPKSRTNIAECVGESSQGYQTNVDSVGDETSNRGPYTRTGTKFQTVIENNCSFPIDITLQSAWGKSSQRVAVGGRYLVPKETSYGPVRRAD